jgi:hypothetical protein
MNRKIWVLCVLVLVLGFLFVLLYPSVFFRPFEDFKGPDYVPVGFNNTENLTNSNERIFEYDGDGSFYVGVIKNTSQSAELDSFVNPFKDDPSNVVRYGEDININNHTVRFEVSEKNFHMDAQNLEKIKQKLPENLSSEVNIPNTNIPALDIQMAKFQAIWTCNETGLTYIAVGLVTHDKIEDIKKMTTTIHCHPKKSFLQTIWK